MKKAFTLAEVLITLAIIGIVAALTIPSVISNYQQQEFKTGLKKAVSVLNEAIQTNIALDGETPYENHDLFNYLKRHMNVISIDQLSHCYNLESGKFAEVNSDSGRCSVSDGSTHVKNEIFYTADGMRFEFPTALINIKKSFRIHETGYEINDQYQGYRSEETHIAGYCGSYGLSQNPNNTTKHPCIIMVDVNGDKKPNPSQPYNKAKESVYVGWGYMDMPVNQNFGYTYPSPSDKKLSDIFSIMITDEKAIPYGVVAQRAMYSK